MPGRRSRPPLRGGRPAASSGCCPSSSPPGRGQSQRGRQCRWYRERPCWRGCRTRQILCQSTSVALDSALGSCIDGSADAGTTGHGDGAEVDDRGVLALLQQGQGGPSVEEHAVKVQSHDLAHKAGLHLGHTLPAAQAPTLLTSRSREPNSSPILAKVSFTCSSLVASQA